MVRVGWKKQLCFTLQRSGVRGMPWHTMAAWQNVKYGNVCGGTLPICKSRSPRVSARAIMAKRQLMHMGGGGGSCRGRVSRHRVPTCPTTRQNCLADWFKERAIDGPHRSAGGDTVAARQEG